jgi:enoyl-[acyl-carrier protein] reductase II
LNKIRLLAYFGAATPRLKAATEQGDLVKGMQFIGQSQGLIHDSPTAQALIERIVMDAKQTWTHVERNIQG